MDILKKRKWGLFIGVFVFIALSYCIVCLPEQVFLDLVVEDGPIESIGAFLFFLTALLFFTLFFRVNAFRRSKDQIFYSTYWRRIFFLLLGFLFLILCGEEISWGQRIFGFSTPEHIKERNMQDEFNVHNLDIFNLRDQNVERKTGLAAYLTAKKIFIYIFVLYLFLVPLVARLSEKIRKLTKRFYLPVPRIQLGILFILNGLLFKALKPVAMGEDPILRGLAEIEEFNFAFILLLLPLIWIKWPSKFAKAQL